MSPMSGWARLTHANCIVISKSRHDVHLQALLPSIKQMSGLPLRELLLDVQKFPDPAAFLALFQRLPQTLRQLRLICRQCDGFDMEPEAMPLPGGTWPAVLQVTALRQALLPYCTLF